MGNYRDGQTVATARVVGIELEEAENGDQGGSVRLDLEPADAAGPYADRPLVLHVGAGAARAFELGDEFEVTFRGPLMARREDTALDRLPRPRALVETKCADGTWKESRVKELDVAAHAFLVTDGGTVGWLSLHDEGNTWRRRGRT